MRLVHVPAIPSLAQANKPVNQTFTSLKTLVIKVVNFQSPFSSSPASVPHLNSPSTQSIALVIGPDTAAVSENGFAGSAQPNSPRTQLIALSTGSESTVINPSTPSRSVFSLSRVAVGSLNSFFTQLIGAIIASVIVLVISISFSFVSRSVNPSFPNTHADRSLIHLSGAVTIEVAKVTIDSVIEPVSSHTSLASLNPSYIAYIPAAIKAPIAMNGAAATSIGPNAASILAVTLTAPAITENNEVNIPPIDASKGAPKKSANVPNNAADIAKLSPRNLISEPQLPSSPSIIPFI